MEWVKVNEENMPPNIEGQLLVWTNHDSQELAWYVESNWCFERDVLNMDSSIKVTHYLKITPPEKE